MKFIKLIVILITMFIILCWLSHNLPHKYYKNYVVSTKIEDKMENPMLHKESIPFLVVMCKGSSKQMTTEKLNQARVMLKSAAAFTKEVLNFTIFSDSESLYQDIVSPMKQWPLEYQRKLLVYFYPVRYPPGSDTFRLSFKPCSTYRLLMPDILQNFDSAVYVDTDIIFLQPPEDMWKEFYKFDNVQAAAFARPPAWGMRDFQKKFHLPGSTYVNAGVGLLNFTRLRSLPDGNFTHITMNLFQQYKDKLTFGDQDILGIFFRQYQYPSLLYELGCEWNYIWGFCKEDPATCLEAERRGASLIHGCAGTFNKGKGLQFLFTAWEEYELGSPIEELLKLIARNLDIHKTKCTTTNITNIVTKKLLNVNSIA